MAVFDPEQGGRLTHGGTFNNNEVSFAAGVAALSQVLTSDVLAEVNGRGDRLRGSLNRVLTGLPMCVTGVGSLLTVHGTPGPVASPVDLKGADDRLKELLFFHLLENGYYMARRGFVALSIDIIDEHVDGFVDTVSSWAHEASV
jgi:glutamate-1-semialdehyde 2,1-aminomutase